jgi:hypothetical protein
VVEDIDNFDWLSWLVESMTHVYDMRHFSQTFRAEIGRSERSGANTVSEAPSL